MIRAPFTGFVSFLGAIEGADANYGMSPGSSITIYCLEIEPGVAGLNVLGSHNMILHIDLSI